MRSEPINPRAVGKHIVAVVDYLQQLGLEATVTKAKHLRVEWSHRGRTFHIGMPCTPRDMDVAANQGCQKIRRVIREAYS